MLLWKNDHYIYVGLFPGHLLHSIVLCLLGSMPLYLPVVAVKPEIRYCDTFNIYFSLENYFEIFGVSYEFIDFFF